MRKAPHLGRLLRDASGGADFSVKLPNKLLFSGCVPKKGAIRKGSHEHMSLPKIVLVVDLLS